MTKEKETLTKAPSLRYVEHDSLLKGMRWMYDYPNGWSLSIICHNASYGGKAGLFEAGFIYDGELTDQNPYENEVLGHLSFFGVTEVMDKVKHW